MTTQFRRTALWSTRVIVLIGASHAGQSIAQEAADVKGATLVEQAATTTGPEPEISSGSESSHKVSPIGRETLTGDWGGRRSRLVADGFTWWGSYISETFGVVRGGLRKGTAYTQQVNVGLDLDMERIAGWQGAKFHFILNDRAGDNTSAKYIGNFFNVQEIYGFQWAKISEISYEQDLAGKKVNLQIGYLPIGTEFGALAGSCDFVNVALCAHPKNFSMGSGWTGYPAATWGAQIRFHARPDITLRAGLFQVAPTVIEKRYAFNLFGARTTGVMMPLEVEYAPSRAKGSKALPGSYKLGFYYDTSNAPRIGEAGEVDDRYGFYANFSQVLTRSPDKKRNLSAIGYLAFNPRGGAPVTEWYLAGLIKTGTFKSRDSDTFGVALIKSVINPRQRRAHAANVVGSEPFADLPAGESVAELAYGAQIREWLVVRPSLQFIFDPGAFSYETRPTAVAAGVQVKVQF